MKHINIRGVLTIFVAVWCTFALNDCTDKQQQEKNDSKFEAAHQQKNYDRLLQLADSLEADGSISQAKACFWRGYAYDRKKDKAKAETNWRQAMEAATASGNEEDYEMYEKSASHLANLLCVSRDFTATLQVAQPAVKRIEELKRDTTSDYVNLLIYIGLSQISNGASEEDTENAFFQACKKHQENIERNRCDATYKEAIAGLVNIAYYCVRSQKYQAALYYTKSFGDLLAEYEQRPGVDVNYIDRQIGRYTIYKAQALYKLGRRQEAAETYNAFLATKFSNSTEGKKLAESYLENSDVTQHAEQS